MKRILLFFISIMYLGVFAQHDHNHDHSHTQGQEHHCGMPIAYHLLEQEGKLEAQKEWYSNSINTFKANKNQLLNRSVNVVYQIPVVVHILWDNANGINITDAQVGILIENLNKDYARTNPDANLTRPMFQGVASSVDLQFCLAKTDPNGQGTTGIVRVQTTHGQFDPSPPPAGADNAEDIKFTADGGDDAWDTERYLNIWVGDLTGGTGEGIVGYSTLPGSHGAPNDGFIMDVVAVAAEALDRTPTHEIGHYFGLLHPWGSGDPASEGGPSGCNDDDGITDTPVTSDWHLGGECDDAMDSCPADPGEDQFENFMDYSNCTNMFTIEQAALMIQTVEGTRASLLNNNLCSPPVLTADFTPNTPTIALNTGQSQTFTSTSNGPLPITSYAWTFQGGDATSLSTATSTVTYNTPGTFMVKLVVGDGNDTDTKTVDALVEVTDVLNANFEADITYVPIGDAVTFTDLSSGPIDITSWTWDFGNGENSTDQNPAPVVYATEGFYTVELVITDADGENTETKTEYIEAYDPLALNIIDFIGVPTTINVGDNVNFEVESNQADSDIDSVRWFFEGTEIETYYSSNTNPFNVNYATGGIFDVECRIYRANGTDGDTLVKEDYIVVIDQDSIPVANFTASSSNIQVNTTIDFYNLTTNMNRVDSVKWIIETAPGVIEESTDIDPTGFTYPEVGDFDVQLIVYSPFGSHDTLKLGYIHVFDLANLSPIKANFEAVTVRLITQGESVQFEDLSEGDILEWKYEFFRGDLDSAPDKVAMEGNPEVNFGIAGIYTARLIVSSPEYADTLIKQSYIVVTTTPWPEATGYCDTITNIQSHEKQLTYRKAIYPSWGYFPGHYAKKAGESSSEKKIKRYAEKFDSFNSKYVIPDNIRGILVPLQSVYAGDNKAYIKVQIWDADEFGRPNNLISGTSNNKVLLKDLHDNYNYIELDEPIEVDSIFFVGFKLDYKTTSSPQDTFTVQMAPERSQAESNTIYVSTQASQGSWSTPSEFLETINLYSSMGIKIMGCVVNVPEIKELEASINIYPNPASTFLNIDLGEIYIDDINIEMYDIVGKKIHADLNQNQNNHYKINLNHCKNGFYLVNITVNGFQITKKVLIQK